MQIIGGILGKKVADIIGAEHVSLEEIQFPDGEFKFRINTEKLDSDVAVVMRKRANESINAYLVKMYLLTKTLYHADSNIKLVMPYYPFARQDIQFKPTEPLSVEYVASMFDPLITDFFTVTLHMQRKSSITPMFKHAKAVNISGIPALAEALPKVENAFVLGPDTESIVWSKELAGLLENDDYGAFTKERDIDTGEIKITAKDYDFEGKNLIMVDDMASTGGTSLLATKYARDRGVKDVHLSFVHPVLASGALEKLRAANPKSLIAANTLESPISTANVAPLIAKYL
ncbi:MAG: ribose-phosphate diphosphokinase [Candidatus Altiarchaeota archaeon]|nr:ribose-phosphate diphosphokinase [Candidatus Altiarchaeota archaeon]